MTTFTGQVIPGAKRGRTLGFPTANMVAPEDIEEGIYLAYVTVTNKTYNALTFIGKAETFGEKERKAESYLLDFSGDLYGVELTVQLIKKIRNNEKFDSAEELVVKIKKDVLFAKAFFASQQK